MAQIQCALQRHCETVTWASSGDVPGATAKVLTPKRHSSSTRALADSKLTLGEAGRGGKGCSRTWNWRAFSSSSCHQPGSCQHTLQHTTEQRLEQKTARQQGVQQMCMHKGAAASVSKNQHKVTDLPFSLWSRAFDNANTSIQ